MNPPAAVEAPAPAIESSTIEPDVPPEVVNDSSLSPNTLADEVAKEALAEHQAKVDATPPDPVNGFLDLIADPDAEMPAWYRATERAVGQHDIRLTDQDLHDLPPKAQAALFMVRRGLLDARDDADKARSEFAAREAALQERERALEAERTSLHTGMATTLRNYIEKHIKPSDEVGDVDPTSAAGLEATIQSRVHQFLSGFVDTIGGYEEQRVKQVEAAKVAHEEQVRADEMRAWITEHMANEGPLRDKGIRDRVLRLVKSGLQRDEALELAIAREAVARQDDVKLQERVKARARTMRGQDRDPIIPPTPPDLTVEQRYEFYRRYPEAKQRDYEEGLKAPRSLG